MDQGQYQITGTVENIEWAYVATANIEIPVLTIDGTPVRANGRVKLPAIGDTVTLTVHNSAKGRALYDSGLESI